MSCLNPSSTGSSGTNAQSTTSSPTGSSRWSSSSRSSFRSSLSSRYFTPAPSKISLVRSEVQKLNRIGVSLHQNKMYSEANFYYQRAYTLASTLVKDHAIAISKSSERGGGSSKRSSSSSTSQRFFFNTSHSLSSTNTSASSSLLPNLQELSISGSTADNSSRSRSKNDGRRLDSGSSSGNSSRGGDSDPPSSTRTNQVPSFVRWLANSTPCLKNNPPRSRSQRSTPGRNALDEPIQIILPKDPEDDDCDYYNRRCDRDRDRAGSGSVISTSTNVDPRIDIMTILFNEALLLFDVGGAEKLEHAHELLLYALQWFDEDEFPAFTKTDEAVGLLMSIYLMSGLIQLSLYLEIGAARGRRQQGVNTSSIGYGETTASTPTPASLFDAGTSRNRTVAVTINDEEDDYYNDDDQTLIRSAFAAYKEAICLGNVYLHYDHDLLHNAICSQKRARRLIGDFLSIHCAAAA